MARKKRFAPNDNNLAIAYYRFSSHSQNDASIDQQRELAHEWADAHGFKIVQEYEDAAISGTTDARPGFQQMLSEVAKIRPHRGIDGGHGGVLQPPAVAKHPARHGLQRAARPVQRPQAVRLRRGQVHEEVHP